MFLNGDVPARGASPSRGHKRGLAFERSGGNFALSFVLFDVDVILKSLCLSDLIKTINVNWMQSLSARFFVIWPVTNGGLSKQFVRLYACTCVGPWCAFCSQCSRPQQETHLCFSLDQKQKLRPDHFIRGTEMICCLSICYSN